MASLDDIFVREFNLMMRQRKAIYGTPSLSSLPMPEDAGILGVSKLERVYIKGITSEYFSKLNDSQCSLLVRPKLRRRKYDYTGKFIRKGDNYQYEEITVPRTHVGVVSESSIGLPNSYKPKDGSFYVDYVENSSQGKRYIYVVPRNVCYRVNQTALVASWTKLTRAYYYGISCSLATGNILYMYIIPYKPSNADRNYRVVTTGTNPKQLASIMYSIRCFWEKRGYMFNVESCKLDIGEFANTASTYFEGTLGDYMLYDPDRNLSVVQELVDENNIDW